MDKKKLFIQNYFGYKILFFKFYADTLFKGKYYIFALFYIHKLLTKITF